MLNEGLVNVGDYAFCWCTSLESITIPSSVIEIGGYAFSKCVSFSEVVLHEGLLRIGVGAFRECTLQSISLPTSVTEISVQAFLGCIMLREVLCNEGLPKIKHDTFDGCSALERITFPNISSRLEDIIQAGQVDIQDKIQQCIRGVIEWRRGGTICIPVEVTRRRNDWCSVQHHLRRIVTLIKYYELREVTTLFELALWKAKMNLVEDDIYERDDKKAKIDQVGEGYYLAVATKLIEYEADRRVRDTFRVDVPGPVKDSIMQYLL